MKRGQSSSKPTSASDNVTRLLASLLLGSLLPTLAGLAMGQTQSSALQQVAQLKFPVNQQIGYREQQMNSMLRKPREQRGLLWVQDNGAMFMRVLTPRIEQRQLHQGHLILQRPNRQQRKELATLLSQAHSPDTQMVGDTNRILERLLSESKVRTLKLNPNHPGHLMLLAVNGLLSSNTDALQEHFDISQSTNDVLPIQASATERNASRISLIPKAKKLRQKLLGIHLSITDGSLLSLTTERANGSWSFMAFAPPTKAGSQQATRGNLAQP